MGPAKEARGSAWASSTTGLHRDSSYYGCLNPDRSPPERQETHVHVQQHHSCFWQPDVILLAEGYSRQAEQRPGTTHLQAINISFSFVRIAALPPPPPPPDLLLISTRKCGRCLRARFQLKVMVQALFPCPSTAPDSICTGRGKGLVC